MVWNGMDSFLKYKATKWAGRFVSDRGLFCSLGGGSAALYDCLWENNPEELNSNFSKKFWQPFSVSLRRTSFVCNVDARRTFGLLGATVVYFHIHVEWMEVEAEIRQISERNLCCASFVSNSRAKYFVRTLLLPVSYLGLWTSDASRRGTNHWRVAFWMFYAPCGVVVRS
jgi:hypothetical protein